MHECSDECSDDPIHTAGTQLACIHTVQKLHTCLHSMCIASCPQLSESSLSTIQTVCW